MLRFIDRSRDLGFPVDKIEVLLALWLDQTRQRADVKRLATEQIAGLERKAREMQAIIGTLRRLADACCGDHRPDRPILRHEAFEYFAFVIDRPTRVMPLAVDLPENLVEMPPPATRAHGQNAPLMDFRSKLRPKSLPPEADRLVADPAAPFVERVFRAAE